MIFNADWHLVSFWKYPSVPSRPPNIYTFPPYTIESSPREGNHGEEDIEEEVDAKSSRQGLASIALPSIPAIEDVSDRRSETRFAPTLMEYRIFWGSDFAPLGFTVGFVLGICE